MKKQHPPLWRQFGQLLLVICYMLAVVYVISFIGALLYITLGGGN